MDLIYFFVTHSKAWNNDLGYHANFFNDHGGFMLGIVGALLIGIVVACVFYFGCCNSKTTCKYSTISVWTIALVIAAVIGYFYADFVVIGLPKANKNTSVFREYSFYKANDDYCIAKTTGSDVSETLIADYQKKRQEIKKALDEYKDVRLEYDITTAVLAVIVFFLTSLLVKRFTINGRSVPFLNP